MTKKVYSNFLSLLFLTFVLLSITSWLTLDKKSLDYFVYLYPSLSKNTLIVLLDLLFKGYTIISTILTVFIVLFIITRLNKNPKIKTWFKCVYNLFTIYFIHLFIGYLITFSLKIIIGKPRPQTYLGNQEVSNNFFILSTSYHSFPSGHATVLACFIFSLIIFFKLWEKGFFAIILMLLLFVFSITRLILLKHFPSDLFAGFASASLASLLYLYFFDKINKLRDALYPY